MFIFLQEQCFIDWLYLHKWNESTNTVNLSKRHLFMKSRKEAISIKITCRIKSKEVKNVLKKKKKGRADCSFWTSVIFRHTIMEWASSSYDCQVGWPAQAVTKTLVPGMQPILSPITGLCVTAKVTPWWPEHAFWPRLCWPWKGVGNVFLRSRKNRIHKVQRPSCWTT